ncbi:MAG: hypothetical protein ACF8PN_15090 [Phycisphaerales bacterium]
MTTPVPVCPDLFIDIDAPNITGVEGADSNGVASLLRFATDAARCRGLLPGRETRQLPRHAQTRGKLFLIE